MLNFKLIRSFTNALYCVNFCNKKFLKAKVLKKYAVNNTIKNTFYLFCILIGKAIFYKSPNSLNSIFPGYFFTFFIFSCIIRNWHFHKPDITFKTFAVISGSKSNLLDLIEIPLITSALKAL